MNGHGVFTWHDGRIYEGEYRDDQKEGFGVYIAKGKRYEGEWQGGKQHGKGTMSTEGKPEKKAGLWEDGKRIKWL